MGISSKEKIVKHFYIAIGLAILFRLFSVYFVWGPQGLDDYLDNIIPAWKNFTGIPEELHDYRSPLFMWILSYWLKLGSVFDIQMPITQVRWVYFLQLIFSLLAVYGVHRITRNKGKPGISIIATYLVAMHGLMPFISTRSFMESFVMGPLTLGLCLLNEGLEETQLVQKLKEMNPKFNSQFKILLGLIIIGISTLIRFQIGIIYVGWLFLAVLLKNKKLIISIFGVGFLLIILESLIDYGFGRFPFETLYSYVKFNSHQQDAGVMPWYNTWITWLGALFFPFSFLLTKGWKESILKYRYIFFSVFVYVLIHSLNPHKEERYLYPILPLSFIFLSYAFNESIGKWYVKWLYVPIIASLSCVLLFVGSFINTQEGLVGPFTEILKTPKERVLIIDFDNIPMRNFMSAFFVRPPSTYLIGDQNQLSFDFLSKKFNESQSFDKFAVISQKNENENAFVESHKSLSLVFNCSPVNESSSMTDKLLYSLKPEKNERRRPTNYFTCSKT